MQPNAMQPREAREHRELDRIFSHLDSIEAERRPPRTGAGIPGARGLCEHGKRLDSLCVACGKVIP